MKWQQRVDVSGDSPLGYLDRFTHLDNVNFSLGVLLDVHTAALGVMFFQHVMLYHGAGALGATWQSEHLQALVCPKESRIRDDDSRDLESRSLNHT